MYRRDGMTDFTHKHADLIAKLGYIIFAADIFGKGVLPKDIPEMQVEMAKYNKDRLLMRARKLGARILELPTMAMIEGVALTTTTTYVQEHEDEA